MKDSLIKKSKRKFETLVGKHVKYNYQHKPTGVYATMKEFQKSSAGKDAVLTEVYPEHVSEFSISEDFDSVCSDYLRPDSAVQMQPAVVAQVPNARLFTDPIQTNVAVISQDNKVVGEASYQYRKSVFYADPKENLVFDQSFFAKPVKYEGVVLSLLAGYAAMDYFFHWLTDSLPKIKLVKEIGLFEKVDWFLVPTFKYKYQKETLQTLGISEDKVINADKIRHIQADHIITTSMPRQGAHIPVWVYDFYRNDFLNNYSSSTEYPPLVYISRRDAQFRNVTNDNELLTLAKGYGFQEYLLSQMPFAEQAKLFASAEVILAPHGAGLANLVFCKEKTKVIEFFAGGYVKPTYYNLARKTDLEYYFLVFGSPSEASDTKGGVPLNITVDLKEIRQMLDKVVRPASSRPHNE
jgi:hypothetical protein